MAVLFPSLTKTWHQNVYPSLTPTNFDLRGKSAIITGGAGTIGRSTARALAQAGVSTIALTGRNQSTLDAAKNALSAAYPSTEFLVQSADITSNVSIDKAFQDIRSSVGKPVDILVSNAGFLSTPSTIAAADTENWLKGFDTNVKGSLLTLRAFLPIAASDAVVINVSSGIAVMSPLLNVSGYAASKAAAWKLFEYFQAEHPELRTVNVQPGTIASDMNRSSGFWPQDHGELA